jgi:hypothetical protein
MYLSESIVRAIHADRVREMERAARERRLIVANAEPVSEILPGRTGTDRRMPSATTRPGLPA